jgi:hypothetical protein
LYHYLHTSLFDPLLPFRVIDLRENDKAKDELVTGSRNRLMQLVEKKTEAGLDEGRTTIRHYRPMEYVVPVGGVEASVGIEYWVVLNYRKGKKGTDERILRPNSNALFVQPGHPIIGTLNGQTQGELTAQILKAKGLGLVSRHIVIHIDASRVDSTIRRELFASSREGFKEGDVLRGITQVLEAMLEEDETLAAIERELTERISQREAQTTSDEVRRQVTSLLLEAGMQSDKEGPANVIGQRGDLENVLRARKAKYKKADPLPTLPFPQVTKFLIVSPREKVMIRLGDTELILVETDADSEYERQGRLAIRSEPDSLEVSAKAPLRGGRARWRLRPRESAKIGDTGRIIASLTRPDGTQISSEIKFEVLPALEEKAKKQKGIIPPFEIIAINPEDHPDDWGLVWPELAEDASTEALHSVAYKPIKTGKAINIYYSTVFPPFKQQSDSLKLQSPGLSDLFRSNYEVWIAYHAILQENSRSEEAQGESLEVDEDKLEQLYEADRARVATMQVKQAKQIALLMHRISREETVSA